MALENFQQELKDAIAARERVVRIASETVWAARDRLHHAYAELHGLKPGVRLLSGGKEYIFDAVERVWDDESAWLLVRSVKNDGTPYKSTTTIFGNWVIKAQEPA